MKFQPSTEGVQLQIPFQGGRSRQISVSSRTACPERRREYRGEPKSSDTDLQPYFFSGPKYLLTSPAQTLRGSFLADALSLSAEEKPIKEEIPGSGAQVDPPLIPSRAPTSSGARQGVDAAFLLSTFPTWPAPPASAHI